MPPPGSDDGIAMYMAAHRALVSDIHGVGFPHNLIQKMGASIQNCECTVAEALDVMGVSIMALVGVMDAPERIKSPMADKEAIADFVVGLLDRVPASDLEDDAAMEAMIVGLHSVVNGLHAMDDVLSTDVDQLWVYTRMFLKLVSRLSRDAAQATARVQSWLVQNVASMNECYKDPDCSEEATIAWTYMVEHVHPRIARALASKCTDKDAYMAELCASVRAKFAESGIQEDAEKHIAFLMASSR